MIWSLLRNQIVIRRLSAWIVESQTVAASLTIARQPSRGSRLEVSVSGGSGTVTVTGAEVGAGEGVFTSQTLTFSGTLVVMQTSTVFESITTITATGLAGRTISVRAVGRDGSPQKTSAVLVSDWPASIDETTPAWAPQALAGRTQDDTAWLTIGWAETFTPRSGDLVNDEQGRRWEILDAPRPGSGASHWLCRIRRHEGDS
jgi:hypothetical protein